jgi:hypothetical protein
MNRELIVIATIIIATIGVHYLCLPSAQTSQGQEKAQIMSYTSYVENNSAKFFIVVGEVKNNLTTNIKSVTINAIYYDEEDHVIGTQHSYAVVSILKPEQRSPFKIFANLNLSASKSIELTCTCFKTNEEPVTGFTILKLVNDTDKEGYWAISGEIQNNGPRKTSDVKVFCTFYDSSQKVMGMSGTLVSFVMEVGDTETFTLSSTCKYPADYGLIIDATYKPLFDMRYPLFFALVIIFALFIAFMKRRGW